MSSNMIQTQSKLDEMPVNEYVFPELKKKLMTDIEKAETVFIHFDHIAGESESDRNQFFSNLLKAAVYFGLIVEKVDFHRSDP
jgi:hypothetical protein